MLHKVPGLAELGLATEGWKTFVMKQSMMAFSLGFCKLHVEEHCLTRSMQVISGPAVEKTMGGPAWAGKDCEKDPSILKNYFRDYSECPPAIRFAPLRVFLMFFEVACS